MKTPMINEKRRDFVAGLAGIGLAASTGSLFALPSFRHDLFDRVSRWNDTTQDLIFSPERMAKNLNTADISASFPYNGFYPQAYAPKINAEAWRIKVSGRVNAEREFTLADLQAMQFEEQVTRLICIEGWSAVGQWAGVPLASFLMLIGADMNAKTVRFNCADGYYTSIDMASAMHPQSLLALEFLGKPLSSAFGAPLRLRIPVKLGFKNAKFIQELVIGDDTGEGYWEGKGYNWFSGL